MKKWIFLIAPVLFVVVPCFAQIRVCVEPPSAPTGFRSPSDEDTLKTLIGADKAFRENLAKKAKKGVVLSAERCQVTVQLIDRRMQPGRGASTTTVQRNALGQPEAKTYDDVDKVLFATLRVGEYTTEITSQGDTRIFGYWKKAGSNMADRVEDWVKLNAQQIK